MIVSLSGGKDSTAMLHMMLERGEHVTDVVFFDTGWEFPQMYDHLAQVELKTGVSITKLRPEKSFSYWMLEHPIPKRGTDRIHRIGNGWPHATRRWCTGKKTNALNKFNNEVDGTQCVGLASDEIKRVKKANKLLRYPLIEYGVTELAALEYCYKLGYDWGGLYKYFKRVSCFCCPLQSISELKTLRIHFPDLWAQMLTLDLQISPESQGWGHFKNLHVLERRFSQEDLQINLNYGGRSHAQ